MQLLNMYCADETGEYLHGALVATARLSKEHSRKAVDLIDEAGSRAKLRIEGSGKKVLVTEGDGRQVVSIMTGTSVSCNMNKSTVRIFTKADPNYLLTILDGKVILAPSDPGNEYQLVSQIRCG